MVLQVADRSQLETGEVPIALQRENREEVESDLVAFGASLGSLFFGQVPDALAAMPLLSEFCQG